MGIWTCIQPMGGETKLADVFASHFWVYRRPSNSSLDGIGFKFIDFIVIWNIFLYIPLKYLRNWMGYLCFVIWVRYNILAGEKNPAMRGKHARLQYSGQNTPWGILSAWDRFCILSFQSWWLVLRHVNWNPCSFQAASKIQFSFFPAWKVWGCCFLTKQIFGYANLYWPRTLMNIGKTARTLQLACKCIGEIQAQQQWKRYFLLDFKAMGRTPLASTLWTAHYDFRCAKPHFFHENKICVSRPQLRWQWDGSLIPGDLNLYIVGTCLYFCFFHPWHFP